MQPIIKGSFPGSEGKDQDTQHAYRKLPKNKTNFLKKSFTPSHFFKKKVVSRGPGWPRAGYAAQDDNEYWPSTSASKSWDYRRAMGLWESNGITGEHPEPGRHPHCFWKNLPEQRSEEHQSLVT